MAKQDGRSESGVKRRIATTAATAALALSGPAVAARPASARTATPPRTAANPVTRLANSDQAQAASSLDVARRDEMASHRRLLAGALAAEVGGADVAPRLERALADSEARLSSAYSRGERPDRSGGLPADLAESLGISEDELADAFESMSRHALERRRGDSAT